MVNFIFNQHTWLYMVSVGKLLSCPIFLSTFPMWMLKRVRRGFFCSAWGFWKVEGGKADNNLYSFSHYLQALGAVQKAVAPLLSKASGATNQVTCKFCHRCLQQCLSLSCSLYPYLSLRITARSTCCPFFFPFLFLYRKLICTFPPFSFPYLILIAQPSTGLRQYRATSRRLFQSWARQWNLTQKPSTRGSRFVNVTE